MLADNIFLKIINRQIPAKIVYEDERVVVIEDINPQAPLHVLVISKTHIASLNDVTPGHDGLIGEMNRRAAVIARDRRYAGASSLFAAACVGAALFGVFHRHALPIERAAVVVEATTTNTTFSRLTKDGNERIDFGLGQRSIIREFSIVCIGKPWRHFLAQDGCFDRLGPGAGLLVGHERHWRGLTGPVAAFAIFL